jgi:predicted HD superfamily hydrolase involved in NAD metabolism
MHAILVSLAKGLAPTGNLARDADAFLRAHGHPGTAEHSGAVAGVARNLALRLGLDPAPAFAGGWLHDIAAPIPASRRLEAALALGLEVLPEERAYPMILHQKLAVPIARHLFAVEDPAILSAIGCHTTLKPNAAPLDMVVFLADKIAWDQPGAPPYRNALLAASHRSLEAACLVYLTYLWQQRESLAVVHPWMAAAYHALPAQA